MFKVAIISRKPSVNPAMLTKLEKIQAPINTLNKDAVVTAVSFNTSRTAWKFKLPRNSAIKNAPAAPMPAASVGENVRYMGHTLSTP